MRLSGDASKRPPILSGVRVARAGSRADPRAQSLAVAPAAGQHCAVLQVHARIASVQRLDRGHLIEVGDVAAVDAGEAGRIELGLDAGDGDAQRVVMAADAQVDRSEEHTTELQSLMSI